MELGRFLRTILHVDIQQLAFFAIGAAIAQALIRYYLRKRPLPNGSRKLDGPPGKPIIGNLLDVPPYHSWLKFFDWSKQYGPLYQLNLAGQNHIIISTEDIANDLLRERGNIYSSRPHFPMASELLSRNLRPLLIPYGETFRQNRKLMHALINVKISETYEGLQQEQSVRAVRDLLKAPMKYETWFERYSAGLILRLAYSQPVVTGEEPTVRRIMTVVHTLEDMLSPGAYLVDLLPILMRLPSFLAPFKKEGERAHKEEISLFRDLLQQGVNSGEDNFCTQWYKNREAYKMSDDHVAYVIGTLFEAGAGTTSAAMCSFMLAMTLHSKEYALLQEEIDAVVGPDRLPTFEDMPRLPRVRAVAKEVMRWRPVTAGGMPHMLTKDDTYKQPNGETVCLPAGSTVHAVQWSIHREAKLYPDAGSFRPERWLEPGWPTYKEPLDKYPTLQNFSAFGFGRKICPGMNISERSMFILISRVAWAASIAPKVDVEGNVMLPPEYDYVTGANVQPKPFDFDLKPRPGRQAIVEKECDQIWASKV